MKEKVQKKTKQKKNKQKEKANKKKTTHQPNLLNIPHLHPPLTRTEASPHPSLQKKKEKKTRNNLGPWLMCSEELQMWPEAPSGNRQ